MTFRATVSRHGWLSSVLAMAVVLSGAFGVTRVFATPALRFQIDQRGDVIMIGNTLGQDCRAAVPKPVVGNLGACGDPLTIDDSAPDVLWQADSPANGQAQANTTVSTTTARSTAVLNLPQGAQVSYARLYWSGNLEEDLALANSPIQVERPGTGGFSSSVRPDPAKREVEILVGGGTLYQATADVTALVQQYGAGAYRVSNVVHHSFVNVNADIQYAAWSMVVVYRNPAEPVRNITIFDGLDDVYTLPGNPNKKEANLSIRGFNVAAGITPQGRLGIIGYEGDSDKTETVTWNGQALQDGGPNPSNNLFNSTHTVLGSPVSNLGDLPQLTGGPASMSGLDLDVLDISSLIKPGDTSAQIIASSVDDVFYVGALITSIRSRKPVLETSLVADPPSARPGDTITFTSTTKNVGDDDGSDIVIRHPLPDGLTFVPGSIMFVSGPEANQNGTKTDRVGDDQAEITTDPTTGKPVLVIRIGKGANGTKGGTLTPNDAPVVVTYKLKTGPNAKGDIPTQSRTTATPVSNPNLGPTEFPSGNGMQPGAPTIVRVPSGMADIRVTVSKTPADAQPGTPTNYHVDVENVGQTTDPGPIRVRFQVPPGGTIDKVTPGQGWTCTQMDRTINCVRNSPLTAGEKTPAVDVTLRNGAPPAEGNEVTVTVTSDGAIDPNPADNIWSELDGGLRIAGGGFSCSLSRAENLAGLWGLLAAAVALFGLSRWRRRSSASC